jgi:hypothetical protein
LRVTAGGFFFHSEIQRLARFMPMREHSNRLGQSQTEFAALAWFVDRNVGRLVEIGNAHSASGFFTSDFIAKPLQVRIAPRKYLDLMRSRTF